MHLSPLNQETQVQFLGWEDPVVKEMATHSSILAWRIPWTDEPGRLQSIGSPRVGHDLVTKPPSPRIFYCTEKKFYSVKSHGEVDILKQNNQPTNEHKNSAQKQMFLKDLNSTVRKKKREFCFHSLFKECKLSFTFGIYSIYISVYRKTISNIISFFLL